MPGVSEELRNKLEIAEVPFSYPGSRILIYQYPGESKFYVKLAERLINFFPGMESYLSRDPFISDLYLINENGLPLDFQVTARPHSIVLDTAMGSFTIAFQDSDTFYICLPANRKCGIRFTVDAKGGGKIGNGGVVNSYRNLNYASDAKILKNELSVRAAKLNIEFSVHSESESVIRLCIYDSCQPKNQFEKSSKIIQSAENTWNGWFDRLPEVNETYREKYIYAWWVLINNLIGAKGNILYDMAVPSKKGYIGAWLWDSAMHSIAFRHLDPELARNQIRGMLVHQLPDGMLPDAVFDNGIVSEIDHPIIGRVTKPPILAWAAMKIHEVAPDINFIREIYQPLVRWNRWWFDQSDDANEGLVQYNHPYSSGMDDHPVWDYGLPVVSPDINTYLYNQMQSLGRMANLLDKNKEADDWHRRSIDLLNLITSKLWDKKMGLFSTFKGNDPLPTKSIIGLFPIWTGGLTHAMNKRILDHLESPAEFGGDYVLPVVSRDDKDFDPDKMWRGPIWANINYFMIEALTQINETKRANHLRKKTLELIMKTKGIYEYYNAVTGEPGRSALPVFSWTAAVFIDLAIQASAKKRSRA